MHKKVIVLLHGFPGNHRGLLDLANDLGDYRFIIPDLPACGFSEPLHKKHNLKNYSDWLNDFLEILSVEEVIIIGHSFGSRVALIFTNHYSKKVKQLILIAPVLKVEGLLDRIASLYFEITEMLPEYLQKIMISNGFGKKLGDMIIFKSANQRIHTEIIIRDIEEIKKLSPQVSNDLFDEFHKFSLIPFGKKIKIKSLIIAGELDRVAPLYSIQEFSQQLSGSTLEIMKNCGHLLPLEKPKITANIIRNWIEGVHPSTIDIIP